MMKTLTGLVLCLCLTMGLLQGCGPDPDPDIDFATRTTYLLINGDPSTTDRLDWETLMFLGTNEGGSYLATTEEGQKNDFKTNFINSAATTFQGRHLTQDSFSNWRVQSKDTWLTVVVADTPKGKFSVTVSRRTGAGKVASLALG